MNGWPLPFAKPREHPLHQLLVLRCAHGQERMRPTSHRLCRRWGGALTRWSTRARASSPVTGIDDELLTNAAISLGTAGYS